MSLLDLRWAEDVVQICDPIFEAADVGFVQQVQYADARQKKVDAILWEADPQRFAERYPDSGIMESYGAEGWPLLPCIDYWAYIHRRSRRCQLSVEGWNLPDLWLDLDGQSGLDGGAMAHTFARILGVPSTA